jgi:hypothetical protein
MCSYINEAVNRPKNLWAKEEAPAIYPGPLHGLEVTSTSDFASLRADSLACSVFIYPQGLEAKHMAVL